MLREAGKCRARRRGYTLAIGIVAAVSLIGPTSAGAAGNVTVSVNPPQFDQKDGNYAVFSGSVTNAPSPDSDTGCFLFGTTGCIAQFVLYPAGVPGSLQVGPALVWGTQNGPNPSPVSVTINLSTAPGVVPGTYSAALIGYDSDNNLWLSPKSPPFQWPPDDLDLSNVRLSESNSGDSTIRYELDHGGTPFRGQARVRGSVFDGPDQLGTFVHKVKAGVHTRLLPDSIDRRLVEGHRYRIRLDATDSFGRKAHFRGTRER
jgi:hypothetical protein